VTSSFIITPPENLSGPRVYSTDLHPLHFRSRHLTAEARRILLRKIKAKLLTRGTVTINGAHLIQPALAEFLRENVALLSHKLLLPAMREDRSSFADYALDHEAEYLAQGWAPDDIRSAGKFVDEHVQEILPWRVEQASGSYRDSLFRGLSNPTSAVNQRLCADGAASPKTIAAFVQNLEAIDSSEERAVAAAMQDAPSSWQPVLTNYNHACYHLVGAKVLNCEAGLDVTSLHEMRMAEFLQRDGALADDEVCLRLLLEAAIDAINSTALADVLIDSISINDIASVRQALRQSGFQAKYDELLDEFFSAMRPPGAGLNGVDLSRITTLTESLSAHFRSYAQKELPTYRTRTEIERQGSLLRTGFSTVKSVLGIVPGIGTIVGVADAIGSTVLFAKEAIDLGTAFGYHSVALGDARAARERQLKEILQRMGSAKGAIVLSTMREVHNLAALNNQPP
jgi:hypothetical protein